jgi:hypothetical protein
MHGLQKQYWHSSSEMSGGITNSGLSSSSVSFATLSLFVCNNLQLETIKYLFGHNDWEMKIIEQSAVVEENGRNSHVQNNTDQSTQTNNDNVANDY